MKTSIELFSGTGKFTDLMQRAGYFCESVDIRKRKGVCEPDIRADLIKLRSWQFSHKTYNVIYAALPCQIWSIASCNFHMKDGIPQTDTAIEHIKLLKKLMFFIDKSNPDFFFIENPRGHLRFYKPFLIWLYKKNAMCKTITLSSYGFDTTKPTNIFTNALDWETKRLDSFGRGAKVLRTFNDMTVTQRQSTPEGLYVEIIKYLDHKYQDLK